jgi:hypothetical protein
MASSREERQHGRIVELLPWYVNETLEGAERQAVEEHAAGCARCRGEIATARELAEAVRAFEPAAPSPHPVQLARLLERIDAQTANAANAANAANIANIANAANIAHVADTASDAKVEGDEPVWQPARRPRPGLPRRRLARLLHPGSRRLRQLAVAELAAVLVLGMVLAWQWRQVPPGQPGQPALYRTLSSDAPIVAAPGTVAVRVLFTDSATAARIQHLLASIRGQVTAGPSPLGAYVVAVPSGPGTDSVDLILAHLRAQPEVSFAERVAGAEGG